MSSKYHQKSLEAASRRKNARPKQESVLNIRTAPEGRSSLSSSGEDVPKQNLVPSNSTKFGGLSGPNTGID